MPRPFAASMTLVPGFTTASRPSMVQVTNPGFLGGGGGGGPEGGFGPTFEAGAGGSGLRFVSSAIARPSPSRLLLDLAADHVDAVVGGDEVGEQRARRHVRD